MGSLIYRCPHCMRVKDPAAPCRQCGCEEIGVWQGDKIKCHWCAELFDPYCSEYCRLNAELSEQPKQENGSPEFFALLQDMRDLHIRKNAGYSGADSADPWRNFRQCESFGISAVDGVITRMSDKYSRLQSLWRDAGNERVGESIKDTLLDLASYSLILICLLGEKSNA